MIDIGKYKAILDEGLLLDHYFLLCSLRDGKELARNRRIQGFINLMHKKGYIEDGLLTKKGYDILDETVPDTPIKPLSAILEDVRKETVTKVEAKFDFANWVIDLHKKCADKIKAATGKPQMRPTIDGKPYPFLPNSTDLGRVILRAVNTYKLKDFAKIEATILKYVDKCIKVGKWFPLLNYYIIKGNQMQGAASSMMVTDLESGNEDESNDNPTIHIV